MIIGRKFRPKFPNFDRRWRRNRASHRKTDVSNRHNRGFVVPMVGVPKLPLCACAWNYPFLVPVLQFSIDSHSKSAHFQAAAVKNQCGMTGS